MLAVHFANLHLFAPSLHEPHLPVSLCTYWPGPDVSRNLGNPLLVTSVIKTLSKLGQVKGHVSPRAASQNQGSRVSGKSIFAWVIRGGCHGGSYGSADTIAGPLPTGAQLVSWELVKDPREWGLLCPVL